MTTDETKKSELQQGKMQGTQSLPQQIEQKLERQGFTAVEVVPGSYLVSAKDQEGDPVMMVIGPHSMSIFTTISPDRRTNMANAEAANDSGAAPQTATGAEDGRQESSRAASSVDYITRQQPTDWTAEALIGRSVVNAQNENLGEINNVIVNEKGRVVALTIGVGGFLGIGEKDVGVPFEALEFRPQSMADREGLGQAGQGTSRFETEHSDIQIVLNATQDQLETAPDFAWLNEQDLESATR
jgi:hypothetical protein